jgi:hypothetical protein
VNGTMLRRERTALYEWVLELTPRASKGQIVLPAEFRQMDRIEPGQEFEVERLDRGSTALSGARCHRTRAPSTGCSHVRKRISSCPSTLSPRMRCEVPG